MWLSDEEYVYRQDIKEKKSTGRGAFYKKGGSKSKKCSLPSDYMTKKEREAMNGEVFSYDPRKWYSWEEFKAMPMEYQIKYINSLLTRYNCSFAAIAKYVFQITDVGLRGHFTRNKQLQYINMPTKNIGKALQAGNKKLREDIEKTLWLNKDEEIQNGSEIVAVDDPVTEIGLDVPYEPVQKTLEDITKAHIADTAEYVAQLIGHGIQITAQKMDEIYLERCGMTVAQAMEIMNPDKKEPESSENFTDVQSFSIVMNSLDQDVINYIRDLFGNKNVVVSIEVKEIKE